MEMNMRISERESSVEIYEEKDKFKENRNWKVDDVVIHGLVGYQLSFWLLRRMNEIKTIRLWIEKMMTSRP